MMVSRFNHGERSRTPYAGDEKLKVPVALYGSPLEIPEIPNLTNFRAATWALEGDFQPHESRWLSRLVVGYLLTWWGGWLPL